MSDMIDLRKQITNKITYTDSQGKNCEFKTASLRLPWIISKLWSNKLIGEKPDLFYKNEIDSETVSVDGVEVDVDTNQDDEDSNRVPYKLDIEDIVVEMLEGGVVCYVPKFIDGNYFVDIIPEGSYEFVENEAGEMIYFDYTRNNVKILNSNHEPTTVSIRTIYYIDEKKQACMKEIYSGGVEMQTEPKVIGDVLPPRITKLHKGKPIWYNARIVIKDANDTYTEMMYDMQLSRKLLALPDRFIGHKDPRDKDKMLSLSDSHRAVRAMPMGGSKDDNVGTPQWFEGHYSPDPYIDSLNFQLHLISLNCYFGSRYLSYDKDSNMITATEVNSTDNDLYINRESLLPFVEEVYKHIIRTFDMLGGNAIKEVDVQHGDSIFDNEDKRNNQLSLDAASGLVDTKKYLMERYGLDEDEVEDWLPEPDRMDE